MPESPAATPASPVAMITRPMANRVGASRLHERATDCVCVARAKAICAVTSARRMGQAARMERARASPRKPKATSACNWPINVKPWPRGHMAILAETRSSSRNGPRAAKKMTRPTSEKSRPTLVGMSPESPSQSG